MSEERAKEVLTKLLDTFTPGSILPLIGDICRQHADEARRIDDVVAYRRFRQTEDTLFVMGLGIDGVCPH